MYVFDWGLERFIPDVRLEPGKPITLSPERVRDRPHMTCVPKLQIGETGFT